MSSRSRISSYYVVSPDGRRYGPVQSTELLLWQEEGRLLPETALEEEGSERRVPLREIIPPVQELEPLLSLSLYPVAPPPMQPAVRAPEPALPPPSPEEPPISPYAEDWVQEFRVRTLISALEAVQGTRRQVMINGQVKSIAVPGQIVSAKNARIKYRMRGEGPPRPDGTPTDLVLLLEYADDGRADPTGPLPARAVARETLSPAEPTPVARPTNQPASPPAFNGASPGRVSDAPAPLPPPTPAATVPSLTEIHITLSREAAAAGGNITVTLPDSGTRRIVYLPSGLDRYGSRCKLAFKGKGELLPGGGNLDLKLHILIQD